MTSEPVSLASTEEPPRRRVFKLALRRLGAVVVGSMIGHALITSRPARAAKLLRPPVRYRKGHLIQLAFAVACVSRHVHSIFSIWQLGKTPRRLARQSSKRVRILVGCARIFPAHVPARQGLWTLC